MPGGFGKRGSFCNIKNGSFLWHLLRISNGNRRIRQKLVGLKDVYSAEIKLEGTMRLR